LISSPPEPEPRACVVGTLLHPISDAYDLSLASNQRQRAEVQRPAVRQREPAYVAFDVLVVDGEDVRALALKERKSLLEKVVRRYGLQKSEPVLGDGKAAFRAVCGLDLEGVVAKRLGDPPRTKWWKIVNRDYLQKGPHLRAL
jgi:ATP-dependent DNA ligase